MKIHNAAGIQPGDMVYNCFMEQFKVVEKTVLIPDHNIKFIVRDEYNNTHSYSCDDLYLKDLEDEDDAEKAWINWAKDNKDFFNIFDHIEASKEMYKIGFAHGFEYKKNNTYKELMQK